MPSFIRWERQPNYIRVFCYADQTAWILNLIAFVAAIGAGVPLPLMELWFGQFTTAFVKFNAGHLSSDVFTNEVNRLSLYLVYLFIAKAICTYISAVCISIAAMRTTKELRIAFLKSLLRQEAAYFDLASGGRSPALHVTTTSAMVNQGIAESLSLVIQGVSTFSAAFIVAFATQWKLTLITLAIVPFVIFATAICVSLDARLDKKLLALHSDAGHLAEEVFSSMRTIHAFFLHKVMLKKYDAILAEAEKQGMKKKANQGFLFASDDFAIFCGYALAFHRGIRMYQSGEIEEVGEIVTVIFAMVVAATTLRQMAPQLLTVEKAASAADQLFEVIDKQPLIDSLSMNGIQPSACLGNIRFENVEFSYPSRPDVSVLRGLSLNIPAGKTTAIVGESGSGKSTIISLIQRCYDPDTGALFLNDINLAQLNLKWLRTNFRCVEQEPTLFSATIFENISFGLVGSAYETAPQSERMRLVEEACRIAFADEFIRELPRGYSTLIDGRTLSGGQKQRIAIARSIISDPKVLILDEATSALDATTEAKVLQSLRVRHSSTTCILIAHKMSTIQHADNIVIFEKGKVSSHGSHQELLAQNPTYSRLVRAQEFEYTLGERAEGEQELSAQEEEGNEKEKPIVSLSEVRPEDESTREYGILETIFLLIQEQRRLWPLFMLLAFMCCLAAGIFTVQAIIFARTFEVFQDRNNAKAVSKADFWALIFFLIALAQVVIWFTLGWGSIIVSQRLTRTYRQRLFESLLHHNVAFFDSHESGALTAKLSNAATNLQELMSVNMFLIWMNAINILCSSIFAVASGWKLGLVCVFGALPPLVLSGYLRIRLEGQLERAASTRFEESATIAAEAISAHQVVRSMTLEQTVLARYETQLSGVSTRSIPKISWIMLWYALSQSTQFLAFALGFWYGARLVLRGHYTAPQFFEIFIAVLFGGEAAAMLFQYSSSISRAGIAANLMFQLEKTASRQHEYENRCRPDHETKDPHHQHDQGPDQHHSMSFTFEALTFAYPSRPETQILKGIDVSVPGGKFVAFVGRSGSGKSTLLNLLCRFYDPTSGRILINGNSIYDIPLQEHRREIGLVQQESQFYQGTIRENLLVDDEEAMELALTQANLWTFVKSLPEGLDTPIGIGGSRLSGGQKQRLAIARALVRQPRILLLDEATSALDSDSEKAVQGAILSAAEGRTAIAVAHRLSSIRDADLIYVFEHGRVVECGKHEALILRKGRYYEMWQSQSMA